MSQSPGPFTLLCEMAIQNAITSIQPILGNLISPTGQVMTVPVRSVFSDEEATFSEVVVSFRPGRMPFTGGMNLLATIDPDPINGFTSQQQFYGIRATDSRINLNVKARSDPERFFILDALLSGILAGFYQDPTTGLITEGATILALAANGLIMKGIDTPQFPDPDYQEPRPEGQVYQAVLPLMVDAWFTWVGGQFAVPNIKLQTTADPGYGNQPPNVPPMPPLPTPNPIFTLS